MPPNSPDMDSARMQLALKHSRMEAILNEHIAELAKAGMFDGRLLAMARSDFEKAFLLLDKALRHPPADGSTQREYGKVPLDTPIPSDFTPGIEDQSGRT